ncbi:MAG: ASKHA domain-containing protein [Lachnospiraceae bacterium]|nr:ASKHA domain-containing protein [Lachnospiraceae bacterium]
MPVIEFVNENIKKEVEEGVTIAQAARMANVYLETPCNESGTCGKCKVKVDCLSEVAAKKVLEDGSLLACQTKILGNIRVETLASARDNDSLKILSEGEGRAVEIDLPVTKQQDGDRTAICRQAKVVGYEDGDTMDQLFGVTVDIGTTTIVSALIDMREGREVDTVSAMNPQCVYAQDVVSRIQYTSEHEDGLVTLFGKVRDCINQMVQDLCQANGIRADRIYEIVYSGNTTMMHLATNTDPYSLGQYPYTSKLKGGECFPAGDCGIDISDCGEVYLPPIISSYVGADITSGVLSCQLDKLTGSTLFIDIGTNGEMIMAKDGQLTATSTAAGPAFEGMNITFGMRAGTGAVESFEIDEDGEIHAHVIGDSKAKGICGSGLFDIVGELVRTGLIKKDGRFVKQDRAHVPDKLRDRLVRYEGKPAFLVADDVYLTQLDIRQIQLAKSAIRAGVEAMMGLNEVKEDQVDRVLIAGSFGYHLKTDSLIHVGILPKEMEEKIAFVGNTSKTGGTAFLLNKSYRQQMADIVTRIRPLELSTYHGFEELFIKYMSFDKF